MLTTKLTNTDGSQLLAVAQTREAAQYDLKHSILYPEGKAVATDGRILVICYDHHEPFEGESIGVELPASKAAYTGSPSLLIMDDLAIIKGRKSIPVEYCPHEKIMFPLWEKIAFSGENLILDELDMDVPIGPALCPIMQTVDGLGGAPTGWARIYKNSGSLLLIHTLPNIIIVGQSLNISNKFKQSVRNDKITDEFKKRYVERNKS